MLAILAVSALAWELKSPFHAAATLKYDLVVDAADNGENHQAKMIYTIASQKVESGPAKVTHAWTDLVVDDNPVGQDLSWKGEHNEAGFLVKMEEGEDYRKMLAPLMFVYPNKSVEKDEKWEFAYPKEGDGLSATFQVAGTEKIGDVEALKVTSKAKEKGAEGLTAEGTWWLSESRVIKFQVKVSNWVVPMASGNAMSATLTGTLKK